MLKSRIEKAVTENRSCPCPERICVDLAVVPPAALLVNVYIFLNNSK